MANIRDLNQLPPYWEVVASMEEPSFAHPFFAGLNHNHMPHGEHFAGAGDFDLPHRGRHGPHHRRHRRGEPVTEDEEPTQTETAEDDESSSSSSDEEGHDESKKCKRHGRHGGFHAKGGKGRHGPGRHGRGPWGKFDHPPHPGAFVAWGADFQGSHGGFGPHGGFGHGPHGRFGPYGGRHMRGGFKHGGRGGPHRGFGPFGFKEFGHHHHHRKHHKRGDFFHPEVDVFDTTEAFIVHVSLPGAKKEAVEVKWDPKKFELNVSGTIERPGDEELLKTLALDERRVGTFDRQVRLGSVFQPVEVHVEGITAEMENGVLSIKLPKVETDVVMVTRVDVQ
ncbi:hypothetical protein CBS147343_3268 [Aspergillus niger]|nr:hypothetical protein CBS133816_3670 [Aspergillus niger]KAI2840132.1 hypothetical protein CBS11350_7209 [Aspergillus niger]KAI2922011.1 hypothetical protein CBS147320_7574 [Aspergillus niger]KAI2987897.1 hypothetical protein CBS147344_4389 [Aspergillus niger]KAI3080250.1 hypothetical protein CBS147343_3268 [Aspergillus niger]